MCTCTCRWLAGPKGPTVITLSRHGRKTVLSRALKLRQLLSVPWESSHPRHRPKAASLAGEDSNAKLTSNLVYLNQDSKLYSKLVKFQREQKKIIKNIEIKIRLKKKVQQNCDSIMLV